MSPTGKGLSERQRRMLEFLREFLGGHQYPPSVREIQQACGISSTSVVDYNLHILQREGHIRRLPDISRGIELLEPGAGRLGGSPATLSVPLVGAIAAGQPLPVFDDLPASDPMETVDLPASLARSRRPRYALRVKGLSMVDALIDDGDIVVLEPAEDARNGDLVAAWLVEEGEVTLKRIYLEGPRVRLQPANPLMGPIYADAANVQVRGRVVGVIRGVG